MARIYTITQSVQTGSGSVGGAIQNSGDGAIEFDFTITPGATNQANFINIIQADIKTCILVFNATGSTGGTIGGHLTLKTNSSGSPQDTITLVDGVPIIYNSAPASGTVQFSGNVTEFFSTDASTGAVGGVLSIRSLMQQ